MEGKILGLRESLNERRLCLFTCARAPVYVRSFGRETLRAHVNLEYFSFHVRYRAWSFFTGNIPGNKPDWLIDSVSMCVISCVLWRQ